MTATVVSEPPSGRAEFGALYFDRQHQFGQRAARPSELVLARGEGELFFIALRGAAGGLRAHADLPAGFSLRLYRLAWVNSVSTDKITPHMLTKPDRLVPLTGTWSCPDPCLLVARLEAGPQAVPGGWRLALRFSAAAGVTASVRVPVWCAPLRLTERGPTVQAELGGRASRWDDARMLRLFAFLSDFGINSAAPNPGLVQNPERFYPQLLAMPGIDRARLLYTNARTFFDRHRAGPQTLGKFQQLLKGQLRSRLALAERYPGAFHIKLWDEPHGDQLALVGELYQRLERAKPAALRSEITVAGEPPGKVAAMADILTVGLLQIDPVETRELQRRGKEVWLYANRMHSLEQPYTAMRNVGWLLWRLALDGYLFWDVARWEQDPYNGLYAFDSRYGRGMFVYPGDDPLSFQPSLRLMLFREGLEDYRLLRQLEVSRYDPEINRVLAFRPGKRVYLGDLAPLHDALLRRP